MRVEEPRSAREAADVLRAASGSGLTVRPRGGGTKLAWGRPAEGPDIDLVTGRLGRILELNAADLTAVFEAGLPLAKAQEALGEAGLRAALDPPLGADEAASVGGVVATGDSGPLRHRYGAPRDLLLGITVVLGDGTVARAGGKVIKNVAGYDLAKLFAGSFGTLGLIAQVAVRLHPMPGDSFTAVGSSEDPSAIESAAVAVASAPLELESLDVWWQDGRGELLVRCAGAAPEPRAREALGLMEQWGLEGELTDEDDHLWRRQRAGQRSEAGVVVKISGLPSALARVLSAAWGAGGSVVGRAGLGLTWVAFTPRDTDETIGAIEQLRNDVKPFACMVLDAPKEVREKLDVWGLDDGPELELMRRVKARFDPAGVFNPGVFIGGI